MDMCLTENGTRLDTNRCLACVANKTQIRYNWCGYVTNKPCHVGCWAHLYGCLHAMSEGSHPVDLTWYLGDMVKISLGPLAQLITDHFDDTVKVDVHFHCHPVCSMLDGLR